MKKAGILLGVLALLLVYFALKVPGFLRAENMLDLAEQISVNAILAFGMTLTILIGGIDLSVGAVMALPAAWKFIRQVREELRRHPSFQ